MQPHGHLHGMASGSGRRKKETEEGERVRDIAARARPALAFLPLFSIFRATAAPFSRAPLFLRCNARCFNSCNLLDLEALDDIACDGRAGVLGVLGVVGNGQVVW